MTVISANHRKRSLPGRRKHSLPGHRKHFLPGRGNTGKGTPSDTLRFRLSPARLIRGCIRKLGLRPQTVLLQPLPAQSKCLETCYCQPKYPFPLMPLVLACDCRCLDYIRRICYYYRLLIFSFSLLSSSSAASARAFSCSARRYSLSVFSRSCA